MKMPKGTPKRVRRNITIDPFILARAQKKVKTENTSLSGKIADLLSRYILGKIK